MDLSKQSKIVFVDDDSAATSALIRSLERRTNGLNFFSATNSDQALKLIAQHEPEAVVVDLSIDPARGPQSGLDLIEQIRNLDHTSRVLVLTGHGSPELGVSALYRGAASFLEKPVDADHLLVLLRDAVDFSRLKRSHEKLSNTSSDTTALTGLSSKNSRMNTVIENVAYAASHNQPVLILGETGSGKGIIAQAIHKTRTRRRNNSPFIRFAPTYSSLDLVLSELFGHNKGAFTGATADRKGLVEEANGGTLFVDEIAELPHEVQVLLLDVIQERVFRRVGSNQSKRSDFRLIAATNKTLDEIQGKELLRDDFFHRIAHLTIELPALRERIEDIPELANMFLQQITNSENIAVQGITPEGLVTLQRQYWPGNIRELRAVVEGGVYRANFRGDRFVDSAHFEFNQGRTAKTVVKSGRSFREQVKDFELNLIRDALQSCDQNQSQAAERLQLDRSTLRRIMQRKGLGPT